MQRLGQRSAQAGARFSAADILLAQEWDRDHGHDWGARKFGWRARPGHAARHRAARSMLLAA